MTYSCVQLNDLSDEILLIILKKLNNVEVLSSLFNVNKRLNRIVHDSIFTSDLTLLKYLSDDSTYSLPDPLLDRFCSEILPSIDHKIKWLTLESLSMKRVLLSTNYPNLNGLGIYNIKMKAALSLFTDEITFTDLFKNQILSFVIEIIDKNCYEPNMNIIIFTNIFKNFPNLKYLNFNPSFICDQYISFNWSSPTIFSSTLLTLHVKVSSVIDCLHLLDGRFNQLHTFYVHTGSAYSRQQSLQINNKEKLPNLKCFSLSSAEQLDLYDEIIIPLLHRMSNLEILMFICSFIHLNNKINLPSNKDIQYSFKDFNYNQIISCVNYFRETQCGECHIYSYPYTLRHYYYIRNNFPGGLFKCVRQVSLYDEHPFEHEFFLRIQKSFPLIEKLTLYNKKRQNNKQYRKSKENIEHLSIVEYPYLTNLTLYNTHYDYIEEFLLDTKTCLTNGVYLSLNYKSLKKVTRNFKRNATRINSNKVNRLHISGEFKITEHLKNYFSHAIISNNYYGFI
ncbi:unnamed protein product [Rotaria sordida]|uniref:F-box domain-containing protein n=1 Tax=Rotaria sordida TaxID=392033 RepID=A0A815LX61_9BILA|nr:unnamed protein product [Rotaria sordida]